MDPASEQVNLGAYARFKRMTIYSLLGQMQLSQAQFERLLAATPGTPQQWFVEMADTFRTAFAAGGISPACQAVRQYGETHPEISMIFDYGYANPAVTAQDFCPW